MSFDIHFAIQKDDHPEGPLLKAHSIVERKGKRVKVGVAPRPGDLHHDILIGQMAEAIGRKLFDRPTPAQAVEAFTQG